MKSPNNEGDLKALIKENIEIIKQERTKSEQLLTLQVILKDDELDIEEMASISEGDRTNGSNSPFLLRLLNNSPNGIATEIAREETQKQINILKEEGIIEAPIPDITPETMTGFLSSTTNYLYGCTSYAMSTAVKLIPETLDKLETYSIFSGLTKTIIDQSFKGLVGGTNAVEAVISAGSRVGYGLTGMAIGNSTSYLFDLDPKHLKLPTKILIKNLSKGNSLVNSTISTISSAALNETLGVSNVDITDIIANGIMGYLKEGTMVGGISGAAKRAIFLNVWKALDGKTHLNQHEFITAAIERNFSKEVTDSIMRIFPKEIFAGIVALSTLMVINKYLESNKSKNPQNSILQETTEYIAKNVNILTERQAKIIQEVHETSSKTRNKTYNNNPTRILIL